MSKRSKSKIEDIIESPSPHIHPKIKSGLVQLLRFRGNSLDSLISILKDQDIEEDIRLLACWIIGQLGEKRVLKELLEVFCSQDTSLSLEVAKAIGMLKSKRAVPIFIQELSGDGNADKRAASAYALGLLRDNRAIEILVKVLNNNNDLPKVRAQAAEALAWFGVRKKSVIDALIDGLKDASVEVRFWSTYALGELKVKKAMDQLERMAAEDDGALPGWWPISKEASNAIDRIKQGG